MTVPGWRILKVLLAACAGLLFLITPAAAAEQPAYSCGSGGGPGARLPVLLVHGFNSSSAAWNEDTRSYLATGGRTCIATFDYAPAATEWVTDSRIGHDLAQRIVSLAAASKSSGGPGKVVVVAHSMGGLATRCAASQSCSGVAGAAAGLRAVITLSTPHLGTTWKGYGRSLATPVIQAAIDDACSMSAEDARLASGMCDGSKAFFSSAAAHAFTPGSGELRALPEFPASVPVLAMGASVQIKTSLFGHLSEPIGSAGDLVVSEDSALAEHRTIGGVGGEKILNCGSIDVTFFVRSELQCWHGSMTNDVQFRTEVLKTLRKIAGSGPAMMAGPSMVTELASDPHNESGTIWVQTAWKPPADLRGGRLVGYEVTSRSSGGTFTRTTTGTSYRDQEETSYCARDLSYTVRAIAQPLAAGSPLVKGDPTSITTRPLVDCTPDVRIVSAAPGAPGQLVVVVECTGSGRGGNSHGTLNIIVDGKKRWQQDCRTGAGPGGAGTHQYTAIIDDVAPRRHDVFATSTTLSGTASTVHSEIKTT